MPSAFLWLMLVPSALRAPAPVNRGVRPFLNSQSLPFVAMLFAHPALAHLSMHNVREHHRWPSPFSSATQIFGHLSRPSANVHSGLAHGALVWLNLAVSPSAACSPTCGAKVPHIIALLATRLSAASAPIVGLKQFKRFG